VTGVLADTIVELALRMKIDPKALVDTIERYNTFCKTGKDLEFGRSAGSLQAIKTTLLCGFRQPLVPRFYK
jgi:fumarate reductase flavoprotein subunit